MSSTISAGSSGRRNLRHSRWNLRLNSWYLTSLVQVVLFIDILQTKRPVIFGPFSMAQNLVKSLLERESTRIPLLPEAPCSLEFKHQIVAIDNEHLKAALHLLNDDIHECHEISQAHDGDPEFDLLHSILHRREGDFWNSQWWIGRLKSPLLTELYGGKNLTEAKRNAKSFVKRVENWRDNGKDTAEGRDLQDFQYLELSAIVKHFS